MFDRRGLFAIGVALVFAIGAVVYAGYLGSQAPRVGNSAALPVRTLESPAVPTPSPSPSSLLSGKSIAFLGDGWAIGAGTNCGEPCGYADLAASQLEMKVNVDGIAGTGYSNGGGTSVPGPNPFSTRLTHFESFKPDIAVLAGGQADAAFVQTNVQQAASALMATLKQDMPATRIVVLGPFAPSGQPSAQLLSTRDSIQAAAKSTGLTFIDPLAEQWITGTQGKVGSGNAPQYIAADGQNPTVDGHKYLADRLVADLKQVGIV
ncbi:MAG: SGNH/GDSL hydrolase family protein [Candidatus Dormibacteria bacterium]